MKNEVIIWDSPNGIELPATNEIGLIVGEVAVQLRAPEKKRIIKALENELYDMSAEYLWSRTISILKEKVLSLGDEFVLEMLDRSLEDDVNNISNNEFINLASEIGFINKIARDKFLHASSLVNYYLSRDAEEEMSYFDMQTIVVPCLKYVLGLDSNDFSLSFNNFRDELKSEILDETNEIYQTLLISPYFYKRTTIKTVLNLTRFTEGGEFETVLSNMVLIFSGIWDGLISDDKYTIGTAYAEAINNSNKELSVSLRRVLLAHEGFDYVPENLRSQSFIEYAKKLKSAHFGYDNFYTEPAPAKDLASMGSIPTPALSHCISAALVSKLGNRYGVSSSAQKYVDNILNDVTPSRWEYYFNQAFQVDIDVLFKLLDNNRMLSNWINFIGSIEDKITLDRIKDADTKKLISATLKNRIPQIINSAKKIYNSLQ